LSINVVILCNGKCEEAKAVSIATDVPAMEKPKKFKKKFNIIKCKNNQ
jgi:hypothetical protein